jgi:hypothetical protein
MISPRINYRHDGRWGVGRKLLGESKGGELVTGTCVGGQQEDFQGGRSRGGGGRWSERRRKRAQRCCRRRYQLVAKPGLVLMVVAAVVLWHNRLVGRVGEGFNTRKQRDE